MGVSGQRHAPAAFYPRGKDPGTHWTRGWVGPRAGLDAEARGKILSPCRGSNLNCPVVQPVARHYTDWFKLHGIQSLKTSSPSAGQELSAFYGTKSLITVFIRDHYCTLFRNILIEFNIITPYFLNSHSNIILRSTHRTPKRSLIFMISEQNFVSISHLTHASQMARLSHPYCFNRHKYRTWCKGCKLWSSYYLKGAGAKVGPV
jgi:hypothetical protein